MAKMLRWKEKLVLAFFTLFFSIPSAWALGKREANDMGGPVYSRLVTGKNGKRALGVELLARRPYVRLVRASLVPVSLPLAAGAYVAMAASPATADGSAPAAAAGSTCTLCNGLNGPCCSITFTTCCDPYCGSPPNCWTEMCYSSFMGSVTCHTCGYGTCLQKCC